MSEEELEIKTETIDIDETWLSNPVFSNNYSNISKVKTPANNDAENKNNFVSVADDVNFVKCELFPEEFIENFQENVEEDPLMLDIEADVHKGIRR